MTTLANARDALTQSTVALVEACQRELDIEVRFNEPLARHTTLRLGGPADAWVEPRTIDALAQLLAQASIHRIPVTCIGGGSNLLVRDGGIAGIAVHLRHLRGIEAMTTPDSGLWRVEAGVHTSKLLAQSISHNFTGLEFLAGVPGLVGGGLRMNAGTYLGEFTNVVTQVQSLTKTGARAVREHAECGFAYRSSSLPTDEILVQCTLQLQSGDPAQIQAKVAELRARKSAREPKGVGNNGSTFKNPPGDFAGRLIEEAGLKGLQIGGAQVSPVHANWLVNANPQQCRSSDLLALISRVQETVLARCGVALETEVKIIGEDATRE